MNQNIDNQINMLTGNKLLNMQEVAHYLNISRSFAYQLVQTGQLTSVRLGKSVRVRPKDIQVYIEQNIHLQVDSR